MNTKELRQGNYLQGMSIIKVESIIDGKVNGYYTSGFDGILLTEEILLKCKGVKSSYTSNPELIGASKKYNLGSIIIFQQNEDESVFYTCINEDMDNLIVDTLHQLQNLYFALTGEELEINL